MCMYASAETWEDILPLPKAGCKELNIIISCLSLEWIKVGHVFLGGIHLKKELFTQNQATGMRLYFELPSTFRKKKSYKSAYCSIS